MRTRYQQIFFQLVLGLGLLSLGTTSSQALGVFVRSLEAARLDLGEWSPEHDDIIEVQGEALSYWQSWETTTDKEGAIASDLRRDWSQHRVGYGTQVWTLISPKAQDVFASFPYYRGAMRIYLNGELLAANGRPAMSADAFEAGAIQATNLTLRLRPGPNVIAVQLANFLAIQSQVKRGVLLSSATRYYEYRTQSQGLTWCLGLSFLVMGIYHLLLFLLRREETVLLSFSSFLIMGSFYIFANGTEYFLASLGLSENRYVWFAFGCWAPALASLCLFIEQLFAPRRYRWFPKVILASAALNPLASFFYFPYNTLLGQILLSVLGLELLLSTAVMVHAIRHKKPGSLAFLGSVFLLLGGLLHELLITSGYILGPHIAQWLTFPFLLSQCYILGARFSQAFDDNNRYIQELEQWSQQSHALALGELFGDLSHELKNIFHTNLNDQGLDPLTVRGLLEATVLPEHLRMPLGEAICNFESASNHHDRGRTMEVDRAHPEAKHLRSLRYYLGQLNLPTTMLETLWKQLLEMPRDDLATVDQLLALLISYRSLIRGQQRAKDLSLAILNVSRREEAGFCQLEQVATDLQQLMAVRLRKTQIDWDASALQGTAPIAASSLVQIFLNLAMNAADAIQDLPEQERWIRWELERTETTIHIRILNGGAPIPKELRSKLFRRGFSTKGKQGSGIGLHLSQQIARRLHGDLTLDTTRAMTCFDLRMPLPQNQFVQTKLAS